MGKKNTLILFLIFFMLILSINFVYAGSIEKVSWDKVLAKDGQVRNIVVATTGYPDGTQVSLEISEEDVDEDDYETTLYGVLKNNLLIHSWTAKYQCDGFLCIADPPEYYVKARITPVYKKSGLLDVPDDGNKDHDEGDCGDILHWEGSDQCRSNLFCEGIPASAVGGGGFGGDGCCYDYENWNIDQEECNYAIKGQVFTVNTNQDGSFNSQKFSNVNLFFRVYDKTSWIGKIFNPVFTDYVKANSQGEFFYNPEFNRQWEWNSNILYNWKIEVYALDSNHKLISRWTNSYTNDNEKYKYGHDYIDQRVRIHTDKEYWEDYSSSEFSALASIKGVSESVSKKESPIPMDIVRNIVSKQISPQIKKESNENVQKTISAQPTSDDESKINEEVLYFNWNGIIIIDEENEYFFNTTIQGGYRLTINNEVIYDTLFSNDFEIKGIYLEEGENNLTIEYINMIDRVAPNLLWKDDINKDFELVPDSNLIKTSFAYQYYNVDQELNIDMFEKFETSESNNKLLTMASSNNKLFQVSFLEAPRNSLKRSQEPLVLVHGLHGESGYWDGQMEDDLIDEGYDVWKFYYPNDQRIPYSAALLSDGITYILDEEYNTDMVKVLTHSMGGLVTRSYTDGLAEDSNGIKIYYNGDVSKLIMLGPPNYGSHLANRVLKDEDLGLICQTINEVVGWLLFGKPFYEFNKEEPAYKDLAVGSQFLWDLSYKGNDPNIDTLVITGQYAEFDPINEEWGAPCIPYEADDSDGLVAVSSASLLNKDKPLVIMNKNHLTLYKHLGGEPSLWELIYAVYSGNIYAYVKNWINSFINEITDLYDIIHISDNFFNNLYFKGYLDPGEEYYLNPGDSNSDQNPFTEGSIFIKFIENTNTNDDIRLKDQTYNFKLDQNEFSKIWYHFNDNEGIDHGLTIPAGTYNVYKNGIDTGYDVEIKPAQTTLVEITPIQEYLVTYVIDGDTFDIETGQRVRLIGINSAETGMPCYQEAKDRLKELVENKNVILVKDVSETDKYGRLLRYVYIDDIFVNLALVQEGFAIATPYSPDTKYADLFQDAEEEARSNTPESTLCRTWYFGTHGCYFFYDSPTTTVCGTQDCDYLDTECRDYHNKTKYCDGNGNCATATCNSYTNEVTGTNCGQSRNCPDSACDGYIAEFYPEDGHDTCNGAGTCMVYSCAMETSYCTDNDAGDGVNGLTCGAPCDQDSDCDDTECDQLDGCVGNDYYDYDDVANACLGDCTCESNECGAPTIYENDLRCIVSPIENKLAIEKVKFSYDGKDKTAKDGDTVRNIEPDMDLKAKIYVENLFTDDTEIEDIEITATIESIDDGDDLDEESDNFDIKAGKTKSETLTFEIPLLVDEDTYDMTIEIEGEDENGTKHEAEATIELEVEKEKHKLTIHKATLTPETVKCGEDTNLDLKVINLGSEDEEEVVITLVNDELNFNKKEELELDSGDDEDTIFSQSYFLNIVEDLEAGTYPVEIKVYYNTHNLEDTEKVDLIIEECEIEEKIPKEKVCETGCLSKEKCYPKGTSGLKKDQLLYCDGTNWVNKKELDESCEFDYECEIDSCIDEVCKEKVPTVLPKKRKCFLFWCWWS